MKKKAVNIEDKILVTDYTKPLEDGRYMVHYLAYQNNVILLKILNDHPFLLSIVAPEEGKMVTHILASLGYIDLLIATLSQHTQGIDLLDERGNHILHYLVVRPNALNKLLSEMGPLSYNGVDHQNEKGQTPIAIAIRKNKFKSFESLVKIARANLDLQDVFEAEVCTIIRTVQSPLQWLKFGAAYGNVRLDKCGNNGSHALLICCKTRQWDLLKTLVEDHHVDINLAGSLRMYIIFEIVRLEAHEIFTWAVEKGINLNVRSATWSTPAHIYFQTHDKYDPKIYLPLLKSLNENVIDGNGHSLLDVVRTPDAEDLTKIQKIIRSFKKTPNTTTIKVPTGSHPMIASYTVYSAYVDHIIFFILTILHRHPNKVNAPLLYRKDPIRFTSSYLDCDLCIRLKMRINAIQRLSYSLNNFIEYISPYINYVPKLPVSFPLSCLSFYILSLIGEQTNHSNIIIIDPYHKTIERFDPEGHMDKPLDNWLSKLFQRHPVLKTYEFLGLADCNVYQLIETLTGDEIPGDPIGFCSAWCMWYLEVRIANKKIHPTKLWKKISPRLMKAGIKTHIRNYAIALSIRRNYFVSSFLGQTSINQEMFNDKEARILRGGIDTWLKNRTTLTS